MINDTTNDEISFSRTALVGNQAKTAARVIFEWTPVVTNGRVQFHLALARGEKRSHVSFEINLNQLSEPELERLNQFLIRRHLDMTTHQEISSTIYWLIDCSFCQSRPGLSLAERNSHLRALLLSHTSTGDIHHG